MRGFINVDTERKERDKRRERDRKRIERSRWIGLEVTERESERF